MEKTKGVSGKSETENWVRGKDLEDQKKYARLSNEIGEADNLYGRYDLSEELPDTDKAATSSVSQTQVTEALARSPGIDASRVHFEITGSVITLKGKATSLKESRAMVSILENLRGVTDVRNELEIEEGTDGTIH